MAEKGQMQLSFGMIFSIIIIVATIFVAFFVIRAFLNIGGCVDAGYFYESLDTKVDEAWRSSIVKDSFTLDAPPGIEEVCFGNLSQPLSGGSTKTGEIYNSMKSAPYLVRSGANIFIYPPEKVCKNMLSYHKLSHGTMSGFFCKEIGKDRKVNITMTKGAFDPLVKIS